jgi:hypothetical protein
LNRDYGGPEKPAVFLSLKSIGFEREILMEKKSDIGQSQTGQTTSRREMPLTGEPLG